MSDLKTTFSPIAKAVVATLGLIAQAVNIWVPQYGADAKHWVAVVVAALTAAGVYHVKNR